MRSKSHQDAIYCDYYKKLCTRNISLHIEVLNLKY